MEGMRSCRTSEHPTTCFLFSASYFLTLIYLEAIMPQRMTIFSSVRLIVPVSPPLCPLVSEEVFWPLHVCTHAMGKVAWEYFLVASRFTINTVVFSRNRNAKNVFLFRARRNMLLQDISVYCKPTTVCAYPWILSRCLLIILKVFYK